MDSGDGKVLLVPTFQPTIYHVRANTDGSITVLETIPVTHPDGLPISGLPNPLPYYSGELAYDTLFAQVPFDDWGFDTEGIARTPNGKIYAIVQSGIANSYAGTAAANPSAGHC